MRNIDSIEYYYSAKKKKKKKRKKKKKKRVLSINPPVRSFESPHACWKLFEAFTVLVELLPVTIPLWSGLSPLYTLFLIYLFFLVQRKYFIKKRK